MVNKTIHIIITGEAGKGRSITLNKNTLSIGAALFSFLILLLFFGALRGSHYLLQNIQLQQQTAQLAKELENNTEQLNCELTEVRIKLAKVLREKNEENSKLKQQVTKLKEKHHDLLATSISRLDQRAKVIATVIDKLGVKVKIEEDPEHSGGPYIALDEKQCDRLLCNTNRYLAALEKMPLGVPIHTRISSPFGKRKDPFNKNAAFHPGIDFKGDTGDKVRATGNGKVKRSEYNNHGLGNYITVSHGNGYETTFAHLSKRLVRRGEKITKGQVIGLLGNTGRSTGSHLHYEVRYFGKPVNPMKYIRLGKITVTASR